MPLHKSQTWIGYMNALNNSGYNAGDLNITGIEKFLDINRHFHPIFHHSIPMVYLVDYTSGKYLLISKAVRLATGYEPEDFMNGGVAFTVENYHRDDLKVYNEEIFPERLKILQKIPAAEHANYIFSYNFRLIGKKRNNINLLQRNCFIKSDDKGNPLLSLGMVINITHYKSESPIIQTVDRLSNHPEQSNETVYKKAFYLHDEGRLFTKREKEVLLWTSDGFSSKEIAHKLHLSESTIINHRKNMQAKACVKNVAELVSYSIRQGII